MYYGAEDSRHGLELWSSDGTAKGTRLVKDLWPGASGSSPDNFVAVGQQLFFTATDTAGQELWVTDGTAQGTRRVADLQPGGPDSRPQNLTAFGGKLYFVAWQGSETWLWVSDGTAQGTQRLHGSVPNQDPAAPSSLVVFGARLWFSARHDLQGRELWSTDGTLAGMQCLDLVPGGGSSSPRT